MRSRRNSLAHASRAAFAAALWALNALPSAALRPADAADASPPATLSGAATYRERIALTHDAVFEAALEEESHAGVPAELLASVRKSHPGQVPIAFEFSYDASRIRPAGKYRVRATLSEGGRLRFSGEQAVATPLDRGTQVAVLMHAVSSGGTSESGSSGRHSLGPFPASFAGLLPCADCAGIRYRIDLLESGAYEQRMTYLRSGHDESFYQLGRWAPSDDGRTLTLEGGPDRTQWGVQDHDTLRKLDLEGNRIDSKLRYELTRRRMGSPMEVRGVLSGMFRYSADAARFRECRSGLGWPVAMSDDYRALERAYLAASRATPGADLLVSLEGRIEQRPKIEGRGTEVTLVVEKFLRARPGSSCDETTPSAGLEDSRWRLTELGGHNVTVAKDQHEPWLVLDSRTKRVSGSGGCNRISGSYESGRGTLRFTLMASTMMACPSLDLETQFLHALDATRTYRVSGRTLELRDKAGTVIANLEEANLK